MIPFFPTLLRYRKLLLLLAILSVGAYFRLHNISEYMTFLGDEGRDVLVVKRMIVDHKFTLLGPTASVGGFFMGPIYYYFMLPFLWAWKLDPTGPAVMVALFGVATVFLVYLVGKLLFHETVGFIASSIYAVSPVVIAYSRSSWNPNIVPFFSTLLIFLLYRVVAANRWREIFWVGVVLGIGIQLHYAFLFLFGVVFVWFFLYGRNVKYLRYYGLLVLGFLVGYLPFLAFELRHNFPNTKSIIQFLLKGEETGFMLLLFLKNLQDVVFRLFGRLVFRLPQGDAWGNLPPWQLYTWVLGTWLAILVSIGYTVIAIVKKNTSRFDRKALVLLIVWLGVATAFFGFYQRGIYEYYFGIFFALPFLFTGFILAQLNRGLAKWIAGGVWVGLLVLNWQGRPFLYPPNNQLGQTKRIAAEAFAKTESKPFNFALVADGNSDHAYRYFFELWGDPPVTIENEEIDPKRRSVTDQLIVICEQLDCKPLGHPLWEIAGFGRAQIVGTWDVPFVTIYKLVHYKEP